MKTCTVDGCKRRRDSRGWCGAHYKRWKRDGDVQAHIPVGGLRRNRWGVERDPYCTVEGCERPHLAHGYCQPHWHRWYRHGTPQAHIPVRPPAPEKCSITGCDTKHQALGLCKYHYFASSKYGINNDQIEALESSAVCAICGREASRIDHCHDTGIVRGRLCHACNVGLGLFGDSPDTLREAANYIERQHDKENMS